MSKSRTRHKRRDRRKAKMLLARGVVRVTHGGKVGHSSTEYVHQAKITKR